jgi:hypothetical protein
LAARGHPKIRAKPGKKLYETTGQLSRARRRERVRAIPSIDVEIHEVRIIGEENTYRTAWDPIRRKDLPQSAGADCWETGIRSKGLISIARRAARREERSENCLRGMTLVAMRAAMGVMMAVSGSNAYKVLKQLYITRRV